MCVVAAYLRTIGTTHVAFSTQCQRVYLDNLAGGYFGLCVYCPCLYYHRPYLFISAGLFDVIDGAVARAGEKSSHYGAFLDGSLDRFVDFFVIFSYFKLAIITPYLSLGSWVALAVFCAIMPSFEVAYANHRKAVDDPNETKIWRILNRGEMYPLMLLVILVSIFQPIWAGYVLAFWVVLAAITTLQTLYLALHFAKKAQ